MTLAIGNNPGSGVLTGTDPRTATGGVATFNDLAITVGGGAGYTLVASAPALAAASSGAFDITSPAATLSSLSPFWIRAGSAGFTITINGASFVPNSVVYWNGAARPSQYVSTTQVTAAIPAGDVAGAGTVLVTVVTPAPGGGTTAALDFRIEAATPAVVYVDDGYVGQGADALVGWPFSGTGTHIMGYDAFASVQGGIDAVVAHGTVNVAAGTYAEHLSVTKSVTVLAPNAGIDPNTGTRGAEAIIVEPGDDADNAVSITVANASNVTIDGFIIDGHNPSEAGPINASEAITVANSSDLTIANNVLRNFQLSGIDADGTSGLNSGLKIRQNRVANVPGKAGYGGG